MTTKNIFAGVGVRTTFVNILYDELMKREFVTLADVMCIKRGKPKGFYDNNPKATLSREIYLKTRNWTRQWLFGNSEQPLSMVL